MYSNTIENWEDVSIFNVNKLKPHAYFIPYESVRAAWQNNKDLSPYYKSLNGKWKFHISKSPASRPKDFYKPEFDISKWSDIQVPGNWERQGFDVPIYGSDIR